MNRITTSINKVTSNIKETFNNVVTNAITFVADSIPQRYLADKIKSEVSRRVKETIQSEENDASWHRITDQARTRDLSPLKQDKMIKVVDWLYERNPIAKKILGLMTDFVIGEGITIKADKVKDKEKEQEKLQEIIDHWWKANEWELKQFDKIEELSKYGEQIYLVDVNSANGDVTTMSMPPETINKILSDKKNREILDIIAFYLRAGVEGLKKNIIRMRPVEHKDANSDKTVNFGKKLQGEVFFFTVNRGTFGTRGKSDILCLADWLDIYDRTLYTMTERVVFLLSFIWDITINGATEEELKKRRDELTLNPVKSGTYLFHNEDEEWEAKNPELKGADFNDYTKSVQSILAGGSGLPVHWLFGQGETVNKASAQEMSEPTIRKMIRRQQYINAMFRQQVDFLIQQKIDKGILPKNTKVEDYPYTVIIPAPSQKEAGIIAKSFAEMVPALAISVQNGFSSSETATKLIAMFMNQVGLDVDFKDEMEKAKENPELEAKAIQDAFQKFTKKFNDKKNGVKDPEENKDEKKETPGNE